jgi:hypothetical protein
MIQQGAWNNPSFDEFCYFSGSQKRETIFLQHLRDPVSTQELPRQTPLPTLRWQR